MVINNSSPGIRHGEYMLDVQWLIVRLTEKSDVRENRIHRAVTENQVEALRLNRDKLLDVFCFLACADRVKILARLERNRRRLIVLETGEVALKREASNRGNGPAM